MLTGFCFEQGTTFISVSDICTCCGIKDNGAFARNMVLECWWSYNINSKEGKTGIDEPRVETRYNNSGLKG